MTSDVGAIEFAERVLVLLDRGGFTATYKYAVLLGLIDLCIEHAGRHGEPPSSVTTRQVAKKVLATYWPQAAVFQGCVLKQNPGPQARVLGLINGFRSRPRDPSMTFTQARMAGGEDWERLLTEVEWVLVKEPLPRLQVVGPTEPRFIYQIAWTRDAITRGQFNDSPGFDNTIRFIGDAARHLVRLAGMLRPLLHREWAAKVAQLNALPQAQLEEFLFGASRRTPTAMCADLRELQDGRCFYCQRMLGGQAHVDHFVPWSRHPDDGIENLVVAHAACNGAKSAHLAALSHVACWVTRATAQAAALADIAARNAWEHQHQGSVGTARGIYYNLPRGTPLWLAGQPFQPLDPDGLDGAFR